MVPRLNCCHEQNPHQLAVGGLSVDGGVSWTENPFRPGHSSLRGGGSLVYMGSVAFSTLLLSIAAGVNGSASGTRFVSTTGSSLPT